MNNKLTGINSAKKYIKPCLIILIVILLVLPFIFGKEKREVTRAFSSTTENKLSAYESSYESYLEENGFDGKLASSVIEVDMNNYKTEGELSASKGETGIITEGDGAISFDFTASEAGFYNLELRYLAIPGTTSDIQRSLLIDGKIPYDDCSQIVIRRWWQDDEIQTKAGNELRPNSYEVFAGQDWYVEDADRRFGEPLMFYLEKGKHTISFNTIKEPLEFIGLTFKAQNELPEYSNIVTDLKNSYSVYDGNAITMQAERKDNTVTQIAKSSTSISVQKNHSDSLVNPYHAYYSRYNTIGASSWENPGDAISWTVNVPEEGLYELAFKGRQSTNRGVTSYRRLYVNGSVPYKEVNAVGFDYNSDMTQYVISDANGEAILFHLNAGENTIALENVMGPFGGIVTEVEESLKVLNSTYLSVIQLTGQSPSRYIDYQIGSKIPGFKENMASESERLFNIVDEIVSITGEKGENTALLQKMAIEAKGLSEDPEKVIEELPQLKNNISAVGTWIVKVSAMPLELDEITITNPEKQNALPNTADSFLAGVSNGILRFFASFVIDTSSVGESTGVTEPLTVWVASYGKEQAQIIQTLVDNTFSPKTDIPVRIQLIPADVVLRAALAGTGPDVVVGLSQSTLQDFAMRNATVDLSKLEGFSEVSSVFADSCLETASFNDGVYGLPETANFLMMFYRKDILDSLELSVPTTWTEFIEMLPVLQQNNYGAYVPNAYLNDGSGNLNFYLSLVRQYGGDPYEGEGNDYGIKSGLSSTAAMEAFKDYTDLYTNYGLDKQMDFSNRFRTGEIPIGLANYTTFCQLEIFAPEIKGSWDFAVVPGTAKSDGTVDNQVLVDTVDTVIMRQTDTLDEAWEFLKWWMSSETQLQYCQTVESVMGTAARVATANLEVLEQLPWSNAELRQLNAQLEHSSGIRAVPGYYMTNRMISYAYSDVVSNNSNPRESLYLNVETINKELTRKRSAYVPE
ncbi:extracellular solute-binding protein [Butyrivibrio sp. YAB3001]|uniref:extracellular solute-binding protein n=1 Tax=Butyrivibrio sp. YAB3001 TaxID=1520812 RepID=UPI0008F65F7E|nr:extracellular solute-binding protein [Butyrivibrio sp. YAB3001]SFC27317.1 ABC-type glycerol-3-phosphate transport system, substrate-binding protein [Butyrivibrio sp. YAB3001]